MARGHLWLALHRSPAWLGLLIFFVATNFTMGIVELLITPLVLSFASATTLGLVLSIAGCGMLVGTLVMSAWGGPKRRVYGVLGFTLLQGLLLFLGGLRPNVPLVTAAAFVYLFSSPIIFGSSQAIWQSKVEPDVQGRVFAARAMIAWSALPFAYLSSGPLVDHVFEPLLVPGGPLAGSLGQLIGVGPGRGIGLLFIVLGILSVLATVGGYLYPRLRLVEDELPDAVGDDALAEADVASSTEAAPVRLSP